MVGRGDASRRPDGRIFLSIDAWHGAVFDQLADAMLADLPKPLYTVVDEADLDLTSHWERAGFTTRRREWEYLVPTDPRVTGLGSVLPPSDVTIVGRRRGGGGPSAHVGPRDPRRSRGHASDGRRCRLRCCPARTALPCWTRRSTRWRRCPINTWDWSGWRRAAGSHGSG